MRASTGRIVRTVLCAAISGLSTWAASPGASAEVVTIEFEGMFEPVVLGLDLRPAQPTRGVVSIDLGSVTPLSGASPASMEYALPAAEWVFWVEGVPATRLEGATGLVTIASDPDTYALTLRTDLGVRPGAALGVRLTLSSSDGVSLDPSRFVVVESLAGFELTRNASGVFFDGVNLATGRSGELFALSRVRSSPSDPDADGVPDPSDNCSTRANPRQLDRGGLASTLDPTGSAIDGVGDACQCGDADADGAVSAMDLSLIRQELVTPGGWLAPEELARCSRLAESGACDIREVVVLLRSLSGLDPGIRQRCSAASGS